MEFYNLLKEHSEKYKFKKSIERNKYDDMKNILKIILKYSKKNENFIRKYMRGEYDFTNEQKNLIDQTIIEIVEHNLLTNVDTLHDFISTIPYDKVERKSLIKYCYLYYISHFSYNRHRNSDTNYHKAAYNKNISLIDFQKSCFVPIKGKMEYHETFYTEYVDKCFKDFKQSTYLTNDEFVVCDDFFVLVLRYRDDKLIDNILDKYCEYDLEFTVEMLESILFCHMSLPKNINNKKKIVSRIIQELEKNTSADIIISSIMKMCVLLPETMNYINCIKKPYVIKCDEFIKFILNTRKYNLSRQIDHEYFNKFLSLINPADIVNNTDIFAILSINKELFQTYIKQIDNQFLNMETLYKVCEMGPNNDVLNELLSHKLIPDKKCFELLCQSGYSDFNLTVKILVSNGFVVDLDCVEYALKYEEEIDDLEMFNIKYDDELFKICDKFEYYPKKYINKINKDYIKMVETFKKEPANKIDAFINKKKLIPTNYCFEVAIAQNKNTDIVDYIIKLGYNPSIAEIVHIKDSERRECVYNHFFKKKNMIKLLD
ncbi:MAG: hypothetical protein Terrestrivirus3_75 [Terrestrivirus sp.]|uniref:Uncharacterized protein n=1 Tax=Terrestrivirus sp. TaxID=2487775 RepID=A0A3G4ZLU1_9VIRU|nr:MAG: hypothetical protein Terrestrivirus3_75 [Terrestrivirus sp.]